MVANTNLLYLGQKSLNIKRRKRREGEEKGGEGRGGEGDH